MGYKYEESILKYQQKYVVQDVSKFPKEESHLKGKTVLLTDLQNTSASVITTGIKKWIPTRSLIKVNGFQAKGVRAENADGFAIIAKNALGLPVGLALLGPDKVTSTQATFTIDGKTIIVPLDICCALVQIKEKVSTKVIKKSTSENNSSIPTEVIQAIDASSLRQDIDGIPESVVRLLPNIDIKELKENIYHNHKDVYFDYSGEPHETLAACDKANTVIRHKLIQKACTDLITTKLDAQWNGIRSK